MIASVSIGNAMTITRGASLACHTSMVSPNTVHIKECTVLGQKKGPPEARQGDPTGPPEQAQGRPPAPPLERDHEGE